MQLQSEPTWPCPGLYAVFRSCQSDRVLISQSRPGKMSRSHRDNSCFVAAHFHAIATWPTLTCPILTLPPPRHRFAPEEDSSCPPRRISDDLPGPGTRAVQNVASASPLSWRLPSPTLPAPSPHSHSHARHHAHARHTGNVGVMINMSTQPIGIICRIRYSTNADPRCLEKLRPCPYKPHTLALRHTDASIRLESMRPHGQ